MQGEGAIVPGVDGQDAAVQFPAGKAALGMAAHLPGEQDIARRDRLAVAPGGVRSDGIGDGDPCFPPRKGLAFRDAVLDGRQVHAEQTGQRPVFIVGGKGTVGHSKDKGLGQHGVDGRVKGAGKLSDPNDQSVVFRRRRRERRQRRRYGENRQEQTKKPSHGHGRPPPVMEQDRPPPDDRFRLSRLDARGRTARRRAYRSGAHGHGRSAPVCAPVRGACRLRQADGRCGSKAGPPASGSRSPWRRFKGAVLVGVRHRLAQDIAQRAE